MAACGGVVGACFALRAGGARGACVRCGLTCWQAAFRALRAGDLRMICRHAALWGLAWRALGIVVASDLHGFGWRYTANLVRTGR